MCPFPIRITCLAILFGFCAAADVPRTGSFTTTFTERHPESAAERMGRRYGLVGQPDPKSIYRIEEESFDVFVPKDYDGSAAYGLIVWTNSGKGGHVRTYEKLMAEQKLIWIGAANVPNARPVFPRWGLALDAVHNMSKLYRIDARRIYASGTSGGGRCASMVVPVYAEVFSGALYVCGCNAPVVPANERELGKPITTMAKERRYAFITGSNDSNREDTKGVFANYQAKGFKYIEYLEVPGMGHTNPPVEWYAKAIAAVDKPLLNEAQVLLTQAKGFDDRKKPSEAYLAYQRILTEFPFVTEAVATAKARNAELKPVVDEQLKPEFDKLAARPEAAKLRAFALRWSGLGLSDQARKQADELASKELDAMLAAGGSSLPGKLGKFHAEWESFTVADRALAEYDKLAAAAYTPVAAVTEAEKRAKAAQRFLTMWTMGPTVAQARIHLEEALDTVLATITTIDKPQSKGLKLDAFVKAWPGTKAGAEAQRQLNALIAELKAGAKK